MNRDESLDRRLQDFYDRVPDVEDALPFKDYLLKHEDSRMAWYLLGKQYAAKGQDAKARYCFSQAGEIYEAFENEPAPTVSELPSEKPNHARKYRWLIAAGAAVLLLSGFLIYAGVVLAPERPPLAAETEEPGPTEAGTIASPNREPVAGSVPAHGNAALTAYETISGAAEPDEEGYAELSRLTAQAGSRSALLIRTPRLDEWTDWVRSGKPVLSARAGPAPGAVGLQWHDAKWCECTADDAGDALEVVEAWKPAQETKLLLRTAMIHYRNRTGSWPETPESLAGAYPHNTVAGWTNDMTVWFEEIKRELDNKKDGKIPLTAGWPQLPGPDSGADAAAVPAGQLADLTRLPMEIIVDKTNHRLAVVVGNVLLRNYEVGLGGERTPEGTFYISEKVRNPNGRSDGEFGSRGMTLSDTLYAIHGTNEPDSIGKDESLGCVRMAKEDLEELYDLVPMGTAVTITNGGLPSELRAPPERFRLPAAADETNPRKVYQWLG